MGRRKKLSEVDYLLVPVRVHTALHVSGCKTLDDVCAVGVKGWMRNPNFGKRSLEALKEELERHGRTLAL